MLMPPLGDTAQEAEEEVPQVRVEQVKKEEMQIRPLLPVAVVVVVEPAELLVQQVQMQV
jgi:hypothetical protein